MFSTKQHVVFSKTTRRFFYRILHRSKKILPLVADLNSIIFPSLSILLFESANFSKNPSSHVRVRARLTGVFAFCCHKCHRLAINHYISIYCAKHILILTIKTYKGCKFGKKSHRKEQFLSEIWADILPQISLTQIGH